MALRYLKHRRPLMQMALARLVAEEEPLADENEDARAEAEEAVEARISLNDARLAAVVGALRQAEVRSVIDLGCGEGKLVKRLMEERAFERIAGCDVSARALSIARQRLRIESMPEKQQRKLSLFQGSVVYRDARFSGYDGAALVEVIEHVDASRLGALANTVFGEAKPRVVIVTTPNVEHNALFGMPAGAMRHADHRFEWTRAEFRAWAEKTATEYGYSVEHHPIGEMHETLGAPTQMAVFKRPESDAKDTKSAKTAPGASEQEVAS
ncbi:MAG: methyltransferase domain-containing protein [Polyangiaceae bacterium]